MVAYPVPDLAHYAGASLLLEHLVTHAVQAMRQLGKALLRTYGSLSKLSQREIKELTRVVGVGPAKAVQLVAAFEIGRRVEAQRGAEPRVQVSSPEDVAAVYAAVGDAVEVQVGEGRGDRSGDGGDLGGGLAGLHGYARHARKRTHDR